MLSPLKVTWPEPAIFPVKVASTASKLKLPLPAFTNLNVFVLVVFVPNWIVELSGNVQS